MQERSHIDWHIPVEHVLDTFRALRHRNFRLFWFGQLISLVGTWMQWTAQGWMVQELAMREFNTHNASFYLGLISTLQTLPVMFFTLFAGVIADRRSKLKILVATQSLLMVFVLSLAYLTTTEWLRIWHVAVYALLMGTVFAFDMPTRQSFVKEMVGKEDLLNAIALNSTIFNTARILGPAVAGFLMTLPRVGISGVFLINGLSYIAVITGLLFIRQSKVQRIESNHSVLEHLREGLKYVQKTRELRLLMTIMGIYSIFGFSYAVLMPVMAKTVIKLEESGYGLLMSVAGIGALSSALILASSAKRIKKGWAIIVGGLVYSLGLIGFALSSSFWQAACMLVLIGSGLVISSSSINSLIQELVPDQLRGRVVGIWSFIFAGMGPIGAMFVGVVANQFSPQLALISCGAISLAFVTFLILRKRWFRLL